MSKIATEYDEPVKGWDQDDPLAALFVMPDEMEDMVTIPIWGTPSYTSISNGGMKITFMVPKEFKGEVVKLNDRPGVVLWCKILAPPEPTLEP